MNHDQEIIKDYVARLEKADEAYYNNISDDDKNKPVYIIPDAEYDRMRDFIKKVDPQNPYLKKVGAKVSRNSILEKRTHSIPMGSQDKAHNLQEFQAWVNNNLSQISLITDDLKCNLSHKIDGGSVGFDFIQGRLYQATTRGDGYVGEDITANALKFKGIPALVIDPLTKKPFNGSIRAEVSLHVSDWKEVDPDMLKNPRNCGNGIMRRKNGTQSDLLKIYAFKAYDAQGQEMADTEEAMFKLLEKMGFNVTPWVTISVKDVWNYFTNTLGSQRASLPYWIDGAVCKLDDISAQNELGVSDGRPKGQLALKFETEKKETECIGVVLTVGHTGAIIPTGKFKPVELGGTTVENAALCNWDNIESLEIAIGDTVEMHKAGEIIPQVLRVVKKGDNRREIQEPTKCPCCHGPVERKTNLSGEEGIMLYCVSDNCPAKLIGKVNRFITSLEIMGIGDEVLQSLFDLGYVKNIRDLYLLESKRDQVADIYLNGKTRLGEKRTAKIIDSINSKRKLTLAQFLGSLGIAGLGKRRVQLIQDAVPGQMDSIEDWISGKLLQSSGVIKQNPTRDDVIMDVEYAVDSIVDDITKTIAYDAGVPGMAENIVNGVKSNEKLIRDILACGVELIAVVRKEKRADALNICVTGATKRPRKELIALIEDAGHVFKDSVAKGLNYLVMADPNSTSSKADKARKLGTQCISEEELIKLLS